MQRLRCVAVGASSQRSSAVSDRARFCRVLQAKLLAGEGRFRRSAVLFFCTPILRRPGAPPGAGPGRLNVIGGSLANDDGAASAARTMPVTTPRTSPSSRDSRRFASVPACTSARPARGACTISSTRSSTTPSTRRWPATAPRSTVTIHPDNSVTVRRQRPRDPGRDDGEGAAPGGRGRADRSARRRQVRRRRRLQGLRRPARRRRLGRQRAVRALRRRGPARRLRVDARTTSAARRMGDLQRGAPTKETGTTITFLPDADIFETLDFDFTTLEERMRETAFLTRGLRIVFVDERGDGHRAEFRYEGGIVDFVELPQREQGADPQEGDLVQRRGRRGRGRGRDAVERLLPGVGVLVRQQHQHASRAALT